MKQDDTHNGAGISSQSMRNNIKAKRMRDDIIKTMSKEEIELFRD